MVIYACAFVFEDTFFLQWNIDRRVLLCFVDKSSVDVLKMATLYLVSWEDPARSSCRLVAEFLKKSYRDPETQREFLVYYLFYVSNMCVWGTLPNCGIFQAANNL